MGSISWEYCRKILAVMFCEDQKSLLSAANSMVTAVPQRHLPTSLCDLAPKHLAPNLQKACCGISPRRLNRTASKKLTMAQQQECPHIHLTYIFAPQSKTFRQKFIIQQHFTTRFPKGMFQKISENFSTALFAL